MPTIACRVIGPCWLSNGPTSMKLLKLSKNHETQRIPHSYFLYTLLLLFLTFMIYRNLGSPISLLYISFEDKQDQIEPTFQAFLDRLGFSLIYHFIMKRLILYIIPKGLLHTSAVYPILLFFSRRNEEWPIITGLVTFCNYSQ